MPVRAAILHRLGAEATHSFQGRTWKATIRSGGGLRRGVLRADEEGLRVIEFANWRNPRLVMEPEQRGMESFLHALGAFARQKATRRCRPITSRTTASSDGGRWSSESAYRRGELDEERIARLEALAGWTWTPKRGTPAVRWLSLSGKCSAACGESAQNPREPAKRCEPVGCVANRNLQFSRRFGV